MKNCHIIAHPLSNIVQTLEPPGDKSISHRALMISALAKGTYRFSNFLFSEDCMHTMKIFKQMGVQIKKNSLKKEIEIQGVGLRGLKKPNQILDVGNSGTLIRLITGILSAQPFTCKITGDESIQARPMKRIIDPLSQMGAKISGTTSEKNNDICPPLTIQGNPNLNPIEYTLPMASAQVKSAILLAGLYGDGKTTIYEKECSRDHTERMLKLFGMDIQINNKKIELYGNKELESQIKEIMIPADISSAAFLIVLGLILPNSTVILKNVGLNPTRNKVISILVQAGANITILNEKSDYFEPYADIQVKSSKLENIKITKENISNIIDEIPILSIAALFGKGVFKVTHAKELRFKESDRIHSIVKMIQSMGGDIIEFEDGFELKGSGISKIFSVNSFGDHRIAMSAIIAAIASGQNACVSNCDCIQTSFPNFWELLNQIGAKIE